MHQLSIPFPTLNHFTIIIIALFFHVLSCHSRAIHEPEHILKLMSLLERSLGCRDVLGVTTTRMRVRRECATEEEAEGDR